jgi:spore maturation protein SpmA
MKPRLSGLQIFAIGFIIALVGAVGGFSADHFELRQLALVAFVVTAIGIAIGLVGILYGWATQGKKAVSGSAEAARELRHKIRTFGK